MRGRISGPSSVMLHSPGLARPWNEISEYLHRLSIVEPRDYELAVCATAREHDCPYVWNAHVPLAGKAGISDETIDVVRNRRPVDGLPAHEAAVVSYVRQLLQRHRVEPEVFGTLLAAMGPRGLVELTAWIGRYGALAGILNSFEVWPGEGADPLPVNTDGASLQRGPVRAPEPKARVEQITLRDQMAEADRPTFDVVAEGRGNVRGPWSLLMYAPDLCRRHFDVSNYLRFDSVVEPSLRELAILATARERDCPYVWAAHVPGARKEGTGEAAIAVLRDRGDSSALPPEERDVVDYVRQLLQTHRVDQRVFDRLTERHGVTWLVELTALVGHYGGVTGLLNAFEVSPAPEAAQLPLG
jgi:4-carboxymuconolactone decarboxylase